MKPLVSISQEPGQAGLHAQAAFMWVHQWNYGPHACVQAFYQLLKFLACFFFMHLFSENRAIQGEFLTYLLRTTKNQGRTIIFAKRWLGSQEAEAGGYF